MQISLYAVQAIEYGICLKTRAELSNAMTESFETNLKDRGLPKVYSEVDPRTGAYCVVAIT